MKLSNVLGLSRRIGFVASLAIAITLVTLVSLHTVKLAYAQNEIELKCVSAWTPPFQGTDKLMDFIDRVNKAGVGKVRIKFLGGVEVAPALEQLEYLKRGSFDLCFNTPTYYGGMVPAALVVYYNDLSPTILRESGFRKVFDEMHRKKANVTVLGSLWRGENYSIFSKKPISKADLTGMKIRGGGPQFDDFIKRLGGIPVTVEAGETYQALQRGLVDGAIGPVILVERFRYNEVTEYFISPLLPWVTDGILLAKADRWDALSKDVQKILLDTMVQMEPEVWKYYKDINTKTVKRLQEQLNFKMTTLPPEEAKKYLSLANTVPWEFTKRYDAEWVEKLRSPLAKYLE